MPKIQFEVELHDGASPALAQIMQQAKAAGIEIQGAFTPATSAVNAHAKASQGLEGVIRSERQEHRMRAFAIREGASAVGALAGEESGLTKALQTGAGSLFEFDFALNALGEMGTKAGGSLGQFASKIGALAMPISIVAGAALLLKNEFDSMGKEAKLTADNIHDLEVKLGILRESGADKAAREFDAEWKKAAEGTEMSFKNIIDAAMVWATSTGDAAQKTEAVVKYFADKEAQELHLAGLHKVEAAQKEADEIRSIKLSTFDITQASALREIEQRRESGKQILIDQEAVEFKTLEVKERAEIDKAYAEQKSADVIKAIQAKFAAERIKLEQDYTAKYKEEAASRADADRQAQEFAQKEMLTDASMANTITLAKINLDKLEAEQHLNNATAKEIVDREYALKELQVEEQAAVRQEIETRGLYANEAAIHEQYQLKRQTLEQTTTNKIEAIRQKEVESAKKHGKEKLDIENTVTKGISDGFGNAIGQAIVQAQNLGDAFVRVGERIVEELLTMIAKQYLFDALEGLLSGGTSALADTASMIGLGIGMNLPAFASGGDFIVPPGYENDNYHMKVSSGEHARVTPADQTAQGGGGGDTYNFNISAVDAKSFNDFIKQGSISDAIMSQVRRSMSTGR